MIGSLRQLVLLQFAAFNVLVPWVIGSPASWAQTSADVMPAVVYLQGHKEIKKVEIDGQKVELWVRAPDAERPQPLTLDSSGTGFLVIDNERLYLVTAAHVAASIEFDATATLRGLEDKPLTFGLNQLSGNQNPKWVTLPKHDVAVLPLDPPETFRAAITAVGLEQIYAEEKPLDLDAYLTTVGFPLKLGIREKFSPIVKVSQPASGLFRYTRFDAKMEAIFFILDDPSVAGFSGAPVFRLPRIRVGNISVSQGPFSCVGLVHGTFNDPTGGKFAAIVPSSFVRQAVELAAQGAGK
jgi:hypothetical protein